MSESTADTAAERGLLGAYFARPELLDLHPVAPAAWSVDLHREIVSAMLAVRAKHEACDHASVVAELRSSGVLQSSGDPVYQIAASLMPWIDAGRFADVVTRLHQARRDRDRATAAAGLFSLGDRARGCELLAQIQQDSERDATLSVRDIDTLTGLHIARLKRERENPEAPTLTVPYGVDTIDEAIGGMLPGDLTIVGADTNVGKTHLAQALANGQRARGYVAGIVSCEDPEDVFAAREVARLSGRGGLISGKPWQLAVLAAPRIEEVVRAMTALVVRHGCQVLHVDYVQAIDGNGENRRLIIRDNAARIKACATRLGVPVALYSQVTVDMADTKAAGWIDRGPSKNALRDSRDLAHLAGPIIMLWRARDFDACPVRGKIAKSKRGGNGWRFWFSRGEGGVLIPERGPTPPEHLEQPPQASKYEERYS